MEKFKVCPYCGKHNPPRMLECIQCETDLSNVRVIDENIEQKKEEKSAPESATVRMVRVCDCGHHNPVNARRCENCGEDISDIIPGEERGATQESLLCALVSLDEKYSYKIAASPVCIGREAEMKEYLASKPYVSRRHAELIVEEGCFYIRNMSGTNYTYVNNIRIPQENYELHDGDEIGLGGNMQNGSRQNEAAYFTVRIRTCI